MKRAVYPGVFDPITLGHIDIIIRSLKLTDELIIAIGSNSNKNPAFSVEERLILVEKALEETLSNELLSKIKIQINNDLLVNFLKSVHTNIVIRGVRLFSDFDYEFSLAGINSKLFSDCETIFLATSSNHQTISSSFVKEIAKYNGDVSSLVTKNTAEALKKLYQHN